MSCPQNSFGEPACHITAHPDRPNDKFCATCNQQFVEKQPFEVLNFIILVAFLFWVLITIAQIPQNAQSDPDYPSQLFPADNSSNLSL